MKVLLSDITKLRQTTGAGIMACKRALQESGGDFAKARTILKRDVAAAAAKKADRVTGKGRVEAYTHLDGRVGALVKLACETDFVARDQVFKNLVHELCLQVAAMNPKNVKELLAQAYIRDSGKKVDELIKETIAKLGENIRIEEFARIEV